MKLVTDRCVFSTVLCVAAAAHTLGQQPPDSPIRHTASSPGSQTLVPGSRTVLFTSNFAGADYSARANACLTAVSAQGGGTCESSSEPSANSASESIIVGDGKHHIALILPAGTVTFASGKQLVFRADASIVGQGFEQTGSRLLCLRPNTVNCVQSYDEPSHTLYGAYLSNFFIGTDATSAQVTPGSVGLAAGGPGMADVLESRFEMLKIDSGYFDIGTLVGGAYGCTCYNTFDQVFSNGWSWSVYLANYSRYAGDVNSNTWIGGTQMAHSVGIHVSGGKNTFFHPDIEGAAAHSMEIDGYGNSVIAPYFEADGCLILAGIDQYIEGPLSYGGGNFYPCYAPGTLISAKPKLPGAGYSAGDMVTFTGSGSSGTAKGRIDAVDETGGVISVTITPGGSGYKSTYNYAAIGGTGSGFKATAVAESSNSLIWGPDAAPASIGVTSGVYFGAHDQNSGLASLQANGNPGSVDLNCSGVTVGTYGRNGHCPLAVGELVTTSGQANKGRQTLAELAYASAPTVVATPAGSTAYTYFVVGYDRNGGQTVPSEPVTVANGPDTLGAVLSATPAAKGAGYKAGDTVTLYGSGSDGAATATATAVNATGGVLTLTVVKPGSLYAAIAGGGGKNIFATRGGSGSGLTVTVASSHVLITPPVVDGISCADILKTDTKHLLPERPGTTASCTIVNGLPGRYDYGQAVVPFTPVTRNSTADLATAGNLGIGRECPPGTPSGTICAAGLLLAPSTIASFPLATPGNKGELHIAGDAAGDAGCAVGGGSMQVTCISNGASWVPLAARGAHAGEPASGQRTVPCSEAGSAVFSEPEQRASYKKVVVYLDHCSGRAAYTFPAAFMHPPQLLSQSLTTREFQSITVTSLNISAKDTTGFADLDGF